MNKENARFQRAILFGALPGCLLGIFSFVAIFGSDEIKSFWAGLWILGCMVGVGLFSLAVDDKSK
ncbi:MAG: hypothetical protein HOI45_06040 [Rhodospirillaceae bacterium]|jgi:hypothetical protein|nr:hypothetical protein [Rhodospirillaceae bacterium]